jgi:hypothetical protein
MVIPKPDGGQRELGIPTVTDRLIQQALLQVLQLRLSPRTLFWRCGVASAFGCKFLEYAFWASAQGVKRAVAVKVPQQFKQRIRDSPIAQAVAVSWLEFLAARTWSNL